MKFGWAILSVAMVCAIGVLAGSEKTTTVASGDEVISTTSASPDVGSGAGDAVANGKQTSFSYVGSKKCKMCHMAVHKSWAKTKMAKAFEVLKPGQAVESKTKYDLDPKKDYTRDTGCLKCHTTGFGEKGGYAIPDPNDKKAVRMAKRLEGVGCESCHGPGSGYSKVFMEIMVSKRKYKVEELHAVGLRKIGKATCMECHIDKGLTGDTSKPFDFEKEKDGGTHEHKPLKQRAG